MRRPGRPYSSGSAPQDTWVGGDRASAARPRSDRSTSRVRACAALWEAPTRFGPRTRIGTRLGSSPCGDGPNWPRAHARIPPSTSSGPERRTPRIWGDFARGVRSRRAEGPVRVSRQIRAHRRPWPCSGRPPKCWGGARRAQRQPSSKMVAAYHPLSKTTRAAIGRCASRVP